MCSKFPSIWLEVKREFDSNILIKRFYREWNFFSTQEQKSVIVHGDANLDALKLKDPSFRCYNITKEQGMLEECGLINMNLSV